MDTPPRSASAGDSRPLSGWKEIAEHLGKSVRAVQRWEHDYRLPVHRIKTPSGQIVYAFKPEIDAWRTAMGPKAVQDDTDDEPTDSSSDSQPRDGIHAADVALPARSVAPRGASRWPRGAVAAGAVAAMAIAVAAGGLFLHRATALSSQPARIVVAGESIVARAENGTTLWSYAPGWRPDVLAHSDPADNVRFTQADIDGDGSKETFVVLHAPPLHGEPWRETVYCFSSTGQLRWSYTPNLRLSFGGKTYEGPWRTYGLAASEPSGRQRVWVAYGHHTWWPSFAVELNAAGNATPKYIQSGAIYSLHIWSTETRTYIVTGGVDNAYGRAALAVLDADGPPVTSPQDRGPAEFRCDSCPAAGPEFFALLPRTEINERSSEPYNWISTIRAFGSECVIDTHEQGSEAASAVYYLRSNFTFHDAALDDHYWQLHRRLEAARVLDHPAALCPDRRRLHAIDTWKPDGGWVQASCAFGAAIPGR